MNLEYSLWGPKKGQTMELLYVWRINVCLKVKPKPNYWSQCKVSEIYFPSPNAAHLGEELKSKKYPRFSQRISLGNKVRHLNILHQISLMMSARTLTVTTSHSYSCRLGSSLSAKPSANLSWPVPCTWTGLCPISIPPVHVCYLTWELPLKPGGWLYSVESIILLQNQKK